MLTELRIENFAIIQHLELDFGAGLIAFTGETGAGKSIILDALDALMGGKVDATAIRAGAERALLEGVFSLPAESRAEILAVLQREGLEDESNFLTLAREIRREGRSVARVNGRSVALGLLRELGAFLVDIHGQSEHLSLLNVHQHIRLLDRYANSEAALAAYQETYRKLQAVRRELHELQENEADAARRAELLAFQAEEIAASNLKPGEEDELRHERDRLANAETLASLSNQSLALLEEGDSEAPSISDLAGQVAQALAALSRIDPSQAALSEQADLIAETGAELAASLRDYLENIEFNPRRLEQVEERLNLIHLLKRKYGGTLEAVLAYEQDARRRLDLITHAGERIAELEEQQKALLEELAGKAAALSEIRRKVAEQLGRAIEAELDDLRMAGARFSVDFQRQPDPNGLLLDGTRTAFNEMGVDRVEFLIAPNPGEGLKPLVKIASGGETSRLMLALKNVLARADSIPTLVFDEIDQGIGGRVGMVVGEKLWQLGRRHQVLCVTHLPQLAAFGDAHLRVVKQVEEGRTLTHVEKLDGKTRLEELAQMIGALNEANLTAALETLSQAQRRAQELAEAGGKA